jgi:hypothetical protein
MVLALAFLAMFAQNAIYAQATRIERPHVVTCATCRVEFTTITVIGRPSDPVSIAPNGPRIVQDSRGRFLTFSDEMQLVLYDTRGNFVRAVGRVGDGPGEFSSNFMGVPPPLGFGAGDTVFVFDKSRITVFSPDLRYVRTIEPKPPFNVGWADALQNGNWLVHGQVRSAQSIGYSAHVMDARGAIVKSIGPQETIRPGLPSAARSFFQAPDKNTMWFYDADSLWMQQWSVDGSPVTHLEISHAPYMRGPYGGAVQMLGVDAQGMLWIAGIERRAPPADLATAPQVRSSVDTPSRTPRPSTLEILDPRTGSVLVSQRMEYRVRLLQSGRAAYTIREDTNGFKSFHILSYRIVGR